MNFIQKNHMKILYTLSILLIINLLINISLINKVNTLTKSIDTKGFDTIKDIQKKYIKNTQVQGVIYKIAKDGVITNAEMKRLKDMIKKIDKD